MLAHSREDPGERQLTKLNVLLDEYVNLAYHGIRAKDSKFNVTIERDYDEAVGSVNLVAQDMSRVFLNIMNNACYAVDKKKHLSNTDYDPTIWVSSKDAGDHIEVRIRDNGVGINPEVQEQIFNPFFTTKPTGEGTGLGLSISYDIVVHEHQGEITVVSEEGEFAEFVVSMPKQ
jgi:signal transduction histidine kinase